jgi:hypothetical protein
VRYLVVMALAASGAAAVQMPAPTPTPVGRRTAPDQRPTSVDDVYPDMGFVELDRVAHGGTSYHRKKVVVRGVLGALAPGEYLSLADKGAEVMLIPLDPGDVHDYRPFISLDVEVTGIVRVLRRSDPIVQCGGEMLPESKCEDPDLPVPPLAQAAWPSVSITVVKLVDRGTGGERLRGAERDLTDTGLEAAGADGKPVKAAGQFRGANLCRDLPDSTRRDPRDWVLLTPEGPVWVTGRRPEGSGFRLDPAYRGDVNRWLQVTGRVAASGEALYVRAGKVELVPRPPEAETTPCAP